MNKLKHIIVFLLMVTLVGCGEKEKTNTNEGIIVEENKVDNEEENKTSNKKNIFQSDAPLIEMNLASIENSEVIDYCKVNIPSEYTVAGAIIDENNEEKWGQVDGIKVSELEKFLDLKKEKLTGMYMISGETHIQISNLVKKNVLETISDYKEYNPDGVELVADSAEVYACRILEADKNDDLRFALAVQFDENRLLEILYGGPLCDELSDEELGKLLYDIIIPLD